MPNEDQKTFRALIKDKKVEYNQVGKLSPARFFYKYLRLKGALLCINNGTIQFVEPNTWTDLYESRFYNADYSSQNVDEKEDCPFLYATCLTTKRNNEAAWVLYTYDKTGKDAVCVEFQINKHKFRLQLLKALAEQDKIYEGTVTYKPTFFIDHLHRKQILGKDNPSYMKYCKKKPTIPYLTNYLNLLLMKRDAFDHEHETRFFIVKEDKKDKTKADPKNPDNRCYPTIDWIEIIEKVYINAKEDSDGYKQLSDALKAKLDEKYVDTTDPAKLNEKNQIWGTKLKPIPYFVYGEPSAGRLAIE